MMVCKLQRKAARQGRCRANAGNRAHLDKSSEYDRSNAISGICGRHEYNARRRFTHSLTAESPNRSKFFSSKCMPGFTQRPRMHTSSKPALTERLRKERSQRELGSASETAASVPENFDRNRVQDVQEVVHRRCDIRGNCRRTGPRADMALILHQGSRCGRRTGLWRRWTSITQRWRWTQLWRWAIAI